MQFIQQVGSALTRWSELAPLAIRVVIGGLFVLHGIDKFDTGLANVEGFFASSGVPAAGLSAPLVAVLEIVLGAALVAGIATRLAAIVLAVILVGAVIFVKAEGGIIGSAETDLAYLAGLVALTLIGPGRLSADSALGFEAAPPASVPVG